jgi:hypothetical protein
MTSGKFIAQTSALGDIVAALRANIAIQQQMLYILE